MIEPFWEAVKSPLFKVNRYIDWTDTLEDDVLHLVANGELGWDRLKPDPNQEGTPTPDPNHKGLIGYWDLPPEEHVKSEETSGIASRNRPPLTSQSAFTRSGFATEDGDDVTQGIGGGADWEQRECPNWFVRHPNAPK